MDVPKLLFGDELKRALQHLPKYDASIREASPEERLLALAGFNDTFFPSHMACQIYHKLYFAYVNAIKRKASCQRGGVMGGDDSFSIVGISGIGKSTAIGRAITIISNDETIVLNHSKVIPFLIVQVPGDASVKGMLLEVLRLVDDRLKTRYHNDAIRARATTDMIIGLVSTVCRNHLCVLILDEVQHLFSNKNGKVLINSIVQLINVSGITVCFVGTPECQLFFETSLHLARRAVGLSFTNIENDEQFKELCQTLFSYQYTRHYCPITPVIMDWLFTHSMGITAIVVGVLHAGQEMAILNGSERLGLDVLKQAYAERFRTVQPHLTTSHKGKAAIRKAPSQPLVFATETPQNDYESFSLSNIIKLAKVDKKDILVALKGHITIEEIAL